MLQAMDVLTDKENWNRKVVDVDIASNWKSELMTAISMSEKAADYVLAELIHKAKIFETSGLVTSYDADVVKSDAAVPQKLKHAMRMAIAPLENQRDLEKDWHPGSDEKVLDLVHPSLFPVVYGRSNILEDELLGLEDCVGACGKGLTLGIKTGEQLSNAYSLKFQWLPCEVDFKGERATARIASYINNLHPDRYQELYKVIGEVIECAVPLWNQTLSGWGRARTNLRRVPYSEVEYIVDRQEAPDRPTQQEDETEDEFLYREDDWWKEAIPRYIRHPEPSEFKPPETKTVIDLKDDYGEQGLQVIVKLANIHLSPDKPVYDGGTWHVEGQYNEHICATALYYYDTENITESRLSFRQSSDVEPSMDIGYEQNDDAWLSIIFGCKNEENTAQELGSIACKEGRLVTFPNILQHRVRPFELADKAKPGHRKILALFLVDPNIRVISTANVPPQQKHWWADRVREATSLGTLPPEIFNHIIELVDEFPIGMSEAKELRLELMDERKIFVQKHEQQTFLDEYFSLCEH